MFLKLFLNAVELKTSKYIIFLRLLKFQRLWNLMNVLNKKNYENMFNYDKVYEKSSPMRI
jgi:hypothetical protein